MRVRLGVTPPVLQDISTPFNQTGRNCSIHGRLTHFRHMSVNRIQDCGNANPDEPTAIVERNESNHDYLHGMSHKNNKPKTKPTKTVIEVVASKSNPKRTQTGSRIAIKRRGAVVKVSAGRNSNASRLAALPASKHGSAISKEVAAVAVEHAAEQAKALELAKALCCPNMFPSFGVQDGYQSQPSGASSPFMCEPAPLSPTDGSAADSLGIPNDEVWGFAYRDPVCALRFYDAIPRTFQYAGVLEDGSTETDWPAQAWVDYLSWNYNGGTDVHGDKLASGIVHDGDGAGFHWVICNRLHKLVVSGLPASTVVSLSFSVIVNDDAHDYTLSATSTAGGVGTFDLSAAIPYGNAPALPNFFHLGAMYLSHAITNGTFLLTGTAIPLVRQLMLAKFNDVTAIIEKLRYCSLNLMYSNTAPELYRNGFLTGWQVPSNMDEFALMGRGFDDMANRPGAGRIEANEGGHYFWLSSDPSDWRYKDVGKPGSGSVLQSYALDGDSDYLAIALKQPVASGRAGYWTVFTDVQYRHDSPWFPLVYPDHNRRTFELALEIQSRIPQLHCNPFHIKDIFKWIGQHKGQIQGTGEILNAATGNRAGQFLTPFNQVLNTWFR